MSPLKIKRDNKRKQRAFAIPLPKCRRDAELFTRLEPVTPVNNLSVTSPNGFPQTMLADVITPMRSVASTDRTFKSVLRNTLLSFSHYLVAANYAPDPNEAIQLFGDERAPPSISSRLNSPGSEPAIISFVVWTTAVA